MFITYILYSSALDRYYVGSTSMELEQRIKRHNTNHKGFTGRSNDWVIIFEQAFATVQKARKFEKKIKSRGARRFIEGS